MTDTRPDVDFDKLDNDIEMAWMDVLACRKAWSHSPNPDTILAHEEAEAELNKLLEFRHLVVRRRTESTLAY